MDIKNDIEQINKENDDKKMNTNMALIPIALAVIFCTTIAKSDCSTIQSARIKK